MHTGTFLATNVALWGIFFSILDNVNKDTYSLYKFNQNSNCRATKLQNSGFSNLLSYYCPPLTWPQPHSPSCCCSRMPSLLCLGAVFLGACRSLLKCQKGCSVQSAKNNCCSLISSFSILPFFIFFRALSNITLYILFLFIWLCPPKGGGWDYSLLLSVFPGTKGFI